MKTLKQIVALLLSIAALLASIFSLTLPAIRCKDNGLSLFLVRFSPKN